MSTKITLASYDPEDTELGWHLYEEAFESGGVYLELDGVDVKLHLRDPRLGKGGVDIVVRLPNKTATQLGLSCVVPPERWESACNPDEGTNLRKRVEAFRRLRGSVKLYDEPSEPGSEEP
ncbi:hypothetical protein [Paraburkholderia youngii]|uniref:hypothetical protein n=1 Tax=Paraburkholderia youngii TaxID=2782701 RepID=UPI003D1A5934